MAKDLLDSLDDAFERAHRGLQDLFRQPRRTGDPWLDRAWRDLDSLLRRTGILEETAGADGAGDGGAAPVAPDLTDRPGAAWPAAWWRAWQALPAERAKELAADYRNLAVEPPSNREEVDRAWKVLLRTYHPDRFAENPADQTTATEITRILNASHDRLGAWLGGLPAADDRDHEA